jgi:hypothetical protein
VQNSSASSVCVSVKQRSSGADYCRGRCKSRALVAQTAGIVGFMVRNIAHCKITPKQSACIAQMVGTLKTQCSTVPSHCSTLCTICFEIAGTLGAVVAHAVSTMLQSVATLKESGRAEELQIRLVRFDSGPRLHRTSSVAFCNFAKRNIAHRSTLFAHSAPCKTLAARCASFAIAQRCCALRSPPCWMQ